jgi:hypothetical protein
MDGEDGGVEGWKPESAGFEIEKMIFFKNECIANSSP